MLTRGFKTGGSPVKNQLTSIEYKGKVYLICSEDQLRYIQQTAAAQAEFDAYESQKNLTTEELKAVVEKKVADSGFATLNYVLGLMNPDEKKEWQNKYRFTPFIKSSKSK